MVFLCSAIYLVGPEGARWAACRASSQWLLHPWSFPGGCPLGHGAVSALRVTAQGALHQHASDVAAACGQPTAAEGGEIPLSRLQDTHKSRWVQASCVSATHLLSYCSVLSTDWMVANSTCNVLRIYCHILYVLPGTVSYAQVYIWRTSIPRTLPLIHPPILLSSQAPSPLRGTQPTTSLLWRYPLVNRRSTGLSEEWHCYAHLTTKY